MVIRSQRWYDLAVEKQSQWRVRLRDGAVVEIRPLQAADRAALAAAIMRLSDRSRYLRFASPMPRVGPAQLDRLVDLDHRHREALVATDPSTGFGIAVARYAEIDGEPAVVDLAVTVADDWQRRGLGSLMLARVLDRARVNGYRAVRGSALAENRASRALLRAAGFRVRGREGLMIEFERSLAPRRSDGAWLYSPAAS
jgi:L-amino acid N-acyltransferase YncA